MFRIMRMNDSEHTPRICDAGVASHAPQAQPYELYRSFPETARITEGLLSIVSPLRPLRLEEAGGEINLQITRWKSK